LAAISLALVGGVLFGAFAVAQRSGLMRVPDVEVAVVVSCLLAVAVALPITAVAGAAGELDRPRIWPYAVAGLLAPGGSQLFFGYAVRAIGAARSATLIAATPLLGAVPAFLILDEPFHPALPVGAALIVVGAILLSGERVAATDFRRIGILLALCCAALIAGRDNLVRYYARSEDVSGLAAATASLAAGTFLLACFLAVRRGGRAPRALARAWLAFVPAGVLLGLAYCANLEALARGRVTIVSPFYGTEALWALVIAFAALGRSERIGARVLAAAALMVTGAGLIGAFR
jgi:drug/metabolite transporter (DMT)-like permease